jgi:hypothetical protein
MARPARGAVNANHVPGRETLVRRSETHVPSSDPPAESRVSSISA